MSEWTEAQDSTAPVKRRMVSVQTHGKRLTPDFRADLIDFAARRIQDVWNDAGETTAEVLAENVVAAQEWLWISLGHPVAILADTDEPKAGWVCSKCARETTRGYDDGQIPEHHRTCPKRLADTTEGNEQ